MIKTRKLTCDANYEVNYGTYSNVINFSSTITILLHESVQDLTLLSVVCLLSLLEFVMASQSIFVFHDLGNFSEYWSIMAVELLKSLLLILTENLNVCSVDFSCSVISNSLWPQWTAACQASLSITNCRSLLKFMSMSWWCHPTILSSVVPFSSCLQSFPASGSFPMSQFFT